MKPLDVTYVPVDPNTTFPTSEELASGDLDPIIVDDGFLVLSEEVIHPPCGEDIYAWRAIESFNGEVLGVTINLVGELNEHCEPKPRDEWPFRNLELIDKLDNGVEIYYWMHTIFYDSEVTFGSWGSMFGIRMPFESGSFPIEIRVLDGRPDTAYLDLYAAEPFVDDDDDCEEQL